MKTTMRRITIEIVKINQNDVVFDLKDSADGSSTRMTRTAGEAFVTEVVGVLPEPEAEKGDIMETLRASRKDALDMAAKTAIVNVFMGSQIQRITKNVMASTSLEEARAVTLEGVMFMRAKLEEMLP